MFHVWLYSVLQVPNQSLVTNENIPPPYWDLTFNTISFRFNIISFGYNNGWRTQLVVPKFTSSTVQTRKNYVILIAFPLYFDLVNIYYIIFSIIFFFYQHSHRKIAWLFNFNVEIYMQQFMQKNFNFLKKKREQKIPFICC